MAEDVDAGLALVDELAQQGTLTDYHLLEATRADLHRRRRDRTAAMAAYHRALAAARTEPERRFILRRLAEQQDRRCVPTLPRLFDRVSICTRHGRRSSRSRIRQPWRRPPRRRATPAGHRALPIPSKPSLLLAGKCDSRLAPDSPHPRDRVGRSAIAGLADCCSHAAWLVMPSPGGWRGGFPAYCELS